MRGGGSLRHWASIKEEVAPDLLFVQETKDPSGFEPDLLHPSVPPSVLWHPVGHGRWGSAVLCDGASLEPITIPDFAGQVVGGLGPEAFLTFTVSKLVVEFGRTICAADSLLPDADRSDEFEE